MREKMVDALFGEGGIFRVRGIMSLGMVGLVGYLALDGKVSVEQIVPLATMVFLFYFESRKKA